MPDKSPGTLVSVFYVYIIDSVSKPGQYYIGFSEIDVTHFVREHADDELTFLLIRELKWPGEDTDFAGLELDAREGVADYAPRLQILYRSSK